MGALQQIEAAAQEITQICQKERTNKADKEKLLKLHAEIFTNIENLIECEICGATTDLIVTMTIEPVTAKVCKDCGIKALEAGEIRKPTSRKRAPRSRKKASTTAPPKAVPAAKEEQPLPQKQTDAADLYATVENQTRLKKTDIKRLHKIIQEIAGPMNLEHTLQYVKREAELVKLKIEDENLDKAVELLMAS